MIEISLTGGWLMEKDKDLNINWFYTTLLIKEE
jgi:hypothetical protein